MGRIQSALTKARREAKKAKSETGNRGTGTPARTVTPQQFGAHGEPIEVAPRPELLEQACAVTLDTLTLNENRIRGIDSSEPGEAAYKMLRTRVLQRMRSNSWQKLAITSPRADAGKTLTAINLAISLAYEPNQQVILVDLDLRNPKIGTYLGLDPKYSLGDHFKQDVGIEEVLLKPTNLRRLYILPGVGRVEHSSELLASHQMATLTQTLVSTSPSTIVIFDMPPLLEADDMLTFMPQVDALLFVVAQGETTQSDLERSSELFTELNVLGTVLNKSGDEAPSEYY
jgi:Mrp family chromosome partitioning ATPase